MAGDVSPALAERTPITVSSRAISEFRPRPADPNDRLAFRGGLILWGDRHLNGLSSIETVGDEFLTASDFGRWFGGRMVIHDGHLVGLEDTWGADRLMPNGAPPSTKDLGDAEAITLSDGDIFVAVEAGIDLLRYRLDQHALAPTNEPPQRIGRTTNEYGRQFNRVEAALTLPNGDVAIISEPRFEDADGAVGTRLPTGAFSVALEDPWRITGADTAPGGDAFIVERRYEGGINIGMRIRRIGRETLATTRWDGPVLLEADFSDQIDNMEGIAVEERDSELALTLVSDNNANFLQRTLLLRFVVSDPLPRPNPVGREPVVR